MKKILVSFGDKRYKGSLDLLEKSSLDVGKVDEFRRYYKEGLQYTNFWRKNSFILNRPRGAGYWIWKPYIILDAMKNAEYGDVIMYSDAAVEVIDNLTTLFDLTPKYNNGKIFFRLAGHHKNKTWTKRDCFVLMNADEKKYWDAYQTQAAFHLWIKTDENINILKEYLRYLKDPRIVTDDPNMLGRANFMEFRDHRHDQSVLSMMSIKYNWDRLRDPSQFGNEESKEFINSNYKQLFDHHRKKI
jgi:hypothetical protein